MLNVLLLLSVTRRLLQGLDDEGGGGWDNGDGSLSVLDGESDGDTETFLNHDISLELGPRLPTLRGCVPSRQLPLRYLLRPSLVTDREDQSWERAPRRHQLHHRLREGGCRYQSAYLFPPDSNSISHRVDEVGLRSNWRKVSNLHHLDLGGVRLWSCKIGN